MAFSMPERNIFSTVLNKKKSSTSTLQQALRTLTRSNPACSMCRKSARKIVLSRRDRQAENAVIKCVNKVSASSFSRLSINLEDFRAREVSHAPSSHSTSRKLTARIKYPDRSSRRRYRYGHPRLEYRYIGQDPA